MATNLPLRFIIFMGAVLFFIAAAPIKSAPQEYLVPNYDNGPKMSQHIIMDYLVSE